MPYDSSPYRDARRQLEVLRQGSDSFQTTRVDAVLNWSRKYSMFLYPFVTACCGTTWIASAPRCRASRRGRRTC